MKNALKIHRRVQGPALHSFQDVSWYPRKTNTSLPYQNHPSQPHSNDLHHSWFWITFWQILSDRRLLCKKGLRSSTCWPQRLWIFRGSERLCDHRRTREWRHSLAKTSPVRPTALHVCSQFGSPRYFQIACWKTRNSSKWSDTDKPIVWLSKRQKSSLAQNFYGQAHRKRSRRRYCKLNG